MLLLQFVPGSINTLLYEELLDLTNETSPHQRCLNVLMTEPYKPLNGLSPGIMNDIFAVSKHQYNTRHYNLLVTVGPKLIEMVEIQHTCILLN